MTSDLLAIEKYLNYLFEFIGDETDWFKIKVQLVNLCPPKVKKLFSRRHYSTKKHTINDFERKVIDYIQTRSDRTLFIDDTKLHDPNWVSRPRGWALCELNRSRKTLQQKEYEKKSTPVT